MKKLLIICGPTATGKTQLALHIAKKLDGEVVSADSRQVYTYMNIVTGKDIFESQKNEQALSISVESKTVSLSNYVVKGVPIWMYDIVYPDQEFSVSHYARYATCVIEDIHKRNKLPILVGGTGLYISAIVDGLNLIQVPRDTVLRESLQAVSLKELQDLLVKTDPQVWDRLNNSDRNNPRRLMRKIEVAQSKSVPSEKHVQYDTYWIGLRLTKEEELQRIQQRVKQRVEHDAIGEIKKLLAKNYFWELPSMQAIGYSEWKKYIEMPTEEAMQEAVHLWELHELQYAKRQLTWFKKNTSIHWYQVSLSDMREQIVQESTAWYNNNV